MDGDCDGVLTADDCDDNNSASTTVATDADCDGIPTNNDCDDTDTSTMISNDLDCDGVIGTFDCDDEDRFSISVMTRIVMASKRVMTAMMTIAPWRYPDR